MGFQYELLNALASQMGVDLDIDISNEIDESLVLLNQGRYDLVAKNLTVTGDRKKQAGFTEPLAMTRQVLVQRNQDINGTKGTANWITEATQLAGKTIYVPRNSVFAQRIRNLSDEIGSPIQVIELPHITQEQLIELVSAGKIDYTVCHEMVAQVNQHYYSELDVSVPVSLNQKISWAVSKDAGTWLDFLNQWIIRFKTTDQYQQIYHKYFHSSYFQQFADDQFHSNRTGRISKYDDLIKELAGQYHWDWRLIASMVMQESKFRSDAESWKGASGLMQLMPETASQYQVTNITDPRENIRGGLEHLTWLDKILSADIENPKQRLPFVLAAYNAGLGHLADARHLAEKYGRNPKIWKDNVEFFIQKKAEKMYYLDPVVHYGYCRGEETTEYVSRVLDRFKHYTNILPDPDESIDTASWPALQASLR